MVTLIIKMEIQEKVLGRAFDNSKRFFTRFLDLLQSLFDAIYLPPSTCVYTKLYSSELHCIMKRQSQLNLDLPP